MLCIGDRVRAIGRAEKRNTPRDYSAGLIGPTLCKALDAGAHRAQQKGGKMRVVGGL
jgi:hypothetical protein